MLRVDNLRDEKKAQDKANTKAEKNLDNVKKGQQKDVEKQTKQYEKETSKAQKQIVKDEQNFAKEKGKKGEGKASKELAKHQAVLNALPAKEMAKIDELHQKAMKAMAKDKGSLDKDLQKAHSNQFKADGTAKDHPSSKFIIECRIWV